MKDQRLIMENASLPPADSPVPWQATYRYLFILLPPLFVLGLGSLLFELSATSTLSEITASLRTVVQSHGPHELDLHLAETRARYIWFATVLLNLVVPIFAMIICSLMIVRNLTRRQVAILGMLGSGMILFGLLLLVLEVRNQGALYRLVFGFTYLTLESSKVFSPEFLGGTRLAVSTVNVLYVIAPIFALLAASSTFMMGREETEDPIHHIEDQIRHLKGVLNIGSALLVAGVLHMEAWLSWPISLIHDSPIEKGMAGVGLGITIYWGTTYTLLLIATYGPAAGILFSRLRHVLQQKVHQGTIKNPESWLKERGLSSSVGEQLPQIAVMLAPLLASPLGTSFISTVNPMG